MKTKTIAIVDDHALFAKSLAFMIEQISDFKVIQTFINGLEYVKYSQSNPDESFDLILLDINMPNMNGLETMRWINDHQSDQKVVKMIKSGVKGYLLKDCDPDFFKEAMDVVDAGGYFYSDKISKHIFKSTLKTADSLFNDKELLFIKHACSELTYKEIASLMHLSPKTIDKYRENVFIKLNIKSRVALAIYAVRNNLG
jgi:DNA-binding NarL/FixJ family response regulator